MFHGRDFLLALAQPVSSSLQGRWAIYHLWWSAPCYPSLNLCLTAERQARLPSIKHLNIGRPGQDFANLLEGVSSPHLVFFGLLAVYISTISGAWVSRWILGGFPFLGGRQIKVDGPKILQFRTVVKTPSETMLIQPTSFPEFRRVWFMKIFLYFSFKNSINRSFVNYSKLGRGYYSVMSVSRKPNRGARTHISSS